MSHTSRNFWLTRVANRNVSIGAVAAGVAAAIIATALLFVWPKSLPDFREHAAGPDRKAVFFGYVRPLVAAQSRQILSTRERLEEISQLGEIGWFERFWLGSIAEEYRVDHDEMSDDELLEVLLRRVDIVPMDLALAQAAKESAWGTSRFAREGNNLFGEWCFDSGCGLVPQDRVEGRGHEVEAFPSPEASVESYIRNLNTHDGYLDFRLERARLREEGRTLSGLELVPTLCQYSERREAYVEDIKEIIEINDLAPSAVAAEHNAPGEVDC